MVATRVFGVGIGMLSPYLLEQHRAIGWVGERLYSVIFEIRDDEEGEFYHLVTLWKAPLEERTLYEENS